MEYFKIILDNNIIGVITSRQFMYYSPATDSLLRGSKAKGEYVIHKDKLYRDSWMNAPQIAVQFTPATILPITEAEFTLLFEALEKQEKIVIDDDSEAPAPPPEPEPYEDTTTIDFLRSSKIAEMSYQCRLTIEAGVDVELRMETKHFSMDTQDQLNLMSLGVMAQTQELIPYHADGEICIFYTADEINKIVAAATAHKVYHTTYYNALKNYINSLSTIEEIAAITYGVQIPEEYQSEVLKVITHEN